MTLNNFVAGEWVPAADGGTIDRVNPARTDEVVAVLPDSGAADVDRAVSFVAEHREEWSRTAPEARSDVLIRAADLLMARADDLAVELVREEGKTLAEARMETRRTPQNLRYYAGEAQRSLGDTFPTGDGSLVLSVREPVGVVAAVTPWNFPLNIPSRKVGPALAAGNGVVLKPSEVTPLTAQRLVEALLEAGVPAGALALVQGGARAGGALVTHPDVDAVTFTGSTSVGRLIHQSVGPDVRTQLEMGGKNALVVLEDADLERATALIVKGAFGLSGQACTGTSRVVVHEAVADELLRRVRERVRSMVVGDGLAEGVTFGPLATAGQLEKYRTYLGYGSEDGALLDPVDEDAVPDGGWFARPALFTGVETSSRIAQEEIFGPILAFLPVGSYEQAVEVVNGTDFGLSAGIVTDDFRTAVRFSQDVDAGVVKVNQATTGLAMNAPFGGFRMSSTQMYKEQGGPQMLPFYTREKTLYFTP